MTSDDAIKAAIKYVDEVGIPHLIVPNCVSTEFYSAQQIQEICDMWDKKDFEGGVTDWWLVRFQRLTSEGRPWADEFIRVLVRDSDGFARDTFSTVS